MSGTFTLQMNRTIRASAERLFAAWTEPDQLMAWWGPAHVRCSSASVDLRVGGRYHLDNQLPGGRVIRVEGAFERIERPSLLVYSWHLDPPAPGERVTVRFEPHGEATRVSVMHERIATPTSRDEHEAGWLGCLDGLQAYLD